MVGLMKLFALAIAIGAGIGGIMVGIVMLANWMTGSRNLL